MIYRRDSRRCDEKTWPSRLRIGRQFERSWLYESSIGEQACKLLHVEAEVSVSHGSAILIAVMGEHVDDEENAASEIVPERPVDVSQDGHRVIDVVQHQREHRSIE